MDVDDEVYEVDEDAVAAAFSSALSIDQVHFA